MALVIAIVTFGWLLLLRHQLRTQVREALSLDLDQSVMTFHDLQAERVGALGRENSLLAELPTLKALMTSGDDLTIRDGATEFWQLSGNDLFALVDASGRAVAVYTKGALADAGLREAVQGLVASAGKQYVMDGRNLYVCSLRPIYFGNEEEGTLLGYVVSGISMARTVGQISQPTGAEASFLSDGEVVASTLSAAGQASLATQHSLLSSGLSSVAPGPLTVTVGSAQYLAATEDLSAQAISPLRLVVLQSFEPAERSIRRIDRMVVSAGLFALLSGTLLMVGLSRVLTRPLEELSRSVIAFGVGDGEYRIPRYGTQEVRQLSTAFAEMRREIQQANRALVESERLATIGRMASSVSHDLRHYLAAIYANAEFLALHPLTEKERAEIFADVRAAVHGTTDMIESLLIFSKTGAHRRRSPEFLATLLERAAALVRAHPDAEGASIVTHCEDPAQTAMMADGKQMERAMCNLLLNACQSTRPDGKAHSVSARLEREGDDLLLYVTDNGEGIPETIRHNLFEPFVSEGKQKGTGLGLTLAHCIAVEHGGEVVLLHSVPGETIFQMKVARESPLYDTATSSDVERHEKAIEHENLRL